MSCAKEPFRRLTAVASLPANLPPKMRTLQRCSPLRIKPVSMTVLSSVDKTTAFTLSAFWKDNAPSKPVGIDKSTIKRIKDKITGIKVFPDINFFRQDAITVAKSLLGKYLVRRYDNKEIVTKIVETEAYMGITDKAAHVYGDKRTERTDGRLLLNFLS